MGNLSEVVKQHGRRELSKREMERLKDVSDIFTSRGIRIDIESTQVKANEILAKLNQLIEDNNGLVFESDCDTSDSSECDFDDTNHGSWEPATDIDVTDDVYKFDYTYKDYTTTLTVSGYSLGDIQIEIGYCLKLIIDRREQYCTIETLNTRHVDCPLPDRNRGKWLVGLIDELMCKIGIYKIEVRDFTKKQCSLTNSSVDFFLLRVFQGKSSSWYENFGFSPNYIQYLDFTILSSWLQLGLINKTEYDLLFDNESTLTPNNDELNKLDRHTLYLEARVRILNMLHDYPISQFEDDVEEQLDPNSKQYRNDRMSAEYVRILEQYPATDYHMLGQYMSNLWKENCRSYQLMLNLMRQNDKGIGRLVRWFNEYANQLYSKQLWCSK